MNIDETSELAVLYGSKRPLHFLVTKNTARVLSCLAQTSASKLPGWVRAFFTLYENIFDSALCSSRLGYMLSNVTSSVIFTAAPKFTSIRTLVPCTYIVTIGHLSLESCSISSPSTANIILSFSKFTAVCLLINSLHSFLSLVVLSLCLRPLVTHYFCNILRNDRRLCRNNVTVCMLPVITVFLSVLILLTLFTAVFTSSVASLVTDCSTLLPAALTFLNSELDQAILSESFYYHVKLFYAFSGVTCLHCVLEYLCSYQ